MSARNKLTGQPTLLEQSIAKARAMGFELYSDKQYGAVLGIMATRFPGMELDTLRPIHSRSVLAFRWDPEPLISHGIIAADDIPKPPKRLGYFAVLWHASLRRIAGGRLEIFCHVQDDLDPGHALAIFRPSAIRSAARPTALSGQRPYLRLVVDNTRNAAPRAPS